MRSNALSLKMVAVVLLAAASLISIDAAGAAATGDATCTAPWGSLPREGMFADGSFEFRTRVINIRSGRHDCFDRLVVDLDEVPFGYRVQYVDEATAFGMGLNVPLRGGAIIDVTVTGIDGEVDRSGDGFDPPDRNDALDVTGYRTFRQVAYGGSFEDNERAWLGTRARLPFRVFTLAGPGHGSRLVIDVAHRWYTQRTVNVFFGFGDGTDCSEVTGFPRAADGVRAPIRHALDQLVGGPTEIELHLGASSFFSTDTARSIRSINLKSDGLLVVDFTDIRSVIPNASASCSSEALLASLNTTIFRFPVVDRIRYQINGSCDAFFEWLQRDCTDIMR